MAEKIFIYTLLGFTTSEQKLVKGIKCMCLPEKDVMIEPNEVKNALYFTEMYVQKVYMTKAGDHENWVSRSTVVSGEKEPFRDQWYLREDGSEPYGHFDLLENFHPNEGCTKCFEREIGCGWTQFPRCTQWYHEQCFYNSIWLLIFFGLRFSVGWASLFLAFRISSCIFGVMSVFSLFEQWFWFQSTTRISIFVFSFFGYLFSIPES